MASESKMIAPPETVVVLYGHDGTRYVIGAADLEQYASGKVAAPPTLEDMGEGAAEEGTPLTAFQAPTTANSAVGFFFLSR